LPNPPALAPHISGLAITSSVLGIFGLLIGLACFGMYLFFGVSAIQLLVGGIFVVACTVPAILLGHVSLSQIRRSPRERTGKAAAVVGLVVGYIGLILSGVNGARIVQARFILRSSSSSNMDEVMADALASTDVTNAESHYRNALAWKEKRFGRDHVEVARILAKMGKFYLHDRHQMVEAKAFQLRALEIWGKPFALKDREIATVWALLSEPAFVIAGREHLENARRYEAKGEHLSALRELADALDGDKQELDLGNLAIRRAMGRIVSQMPIAPALPEEARRKTVQAEELIRKGDFAEAAACFKDAIRLAPYVPSLHYNLAMMQIKILSDAGGEDRSREVADAIKSLEAYLDLAPDAGDAREVKDRVYRLELMAKKE